MNFGDLIVLVLFVLFVLLPQLNRARQQPAPRRPVPGPRGEQTQPPATEASPPVFPEDPDDEFTRRLADARERVRQATGGNADGRTATVGSTVVDPKARAAAPLVRAGPSRVGGGTAGPGSIDPRVRARAPLVTSAARVADGVAEQRAAGGARSRELRRASAPIEVERIAIASRPATSAPAAGTVDLNDWRQGFLWHQILSAPRARRRLGGGPFPTR